MREGAETSSNRNISGQFTALTKGLSVQAQERWQTGILNEAGLWQACGSQQSQKQGASELAGAM